MRSALDGFRQEAAAAIEPAAEGLVEAARGQDAALALHRLRRGEQMIENRCQVDLLRPLQYELELGVARSGQDVPAASAAEFPADCSGSCLGMEAYGREEADLREAGKTAKRAQGQYRN